MKIKKTSKNISIRLDKVLLNRLKSHIGRLNKSMGYEAMNRNLLIVNLIKEWLATREER